jgi:hypothetical protein
MKLRAPLGVPTCFFGQPAAEPNERLLCPCIESALSLRACQRKAAGFSNWQIAHAPKRNEYLEGQLYRGDSCRHILGEADELNAQPNAAIHDVGRFAPAQICSVGYGQVEKPKSLGRM